MRPPPTEKLTSLVSPAPLPSKQERSNDPIIADGRNR